MLTACDLPPVVTCCACDLSLFSHALITVRFDCSSSERMSTDHTSSSVMDTGTASPPHTLTTAHSSHHHTPTAHSSHRQTPAAHSSHHQTPTAHSSHHHTPTAHLDCSPTSGMDTPRGMLCEGEISHDVSLSTYRSHDSDMSHDTVPQSSPGGHSPRADTDRWGHVCSDEEQERRRLEVYKENRRKRYESALEEKLSLLPRTDYYSADSH